MSTYDDAITERDRLVYQAAGWDKGQRIGFGQKPAMVIIDINYNFVEIQWVEICLTEQISKDSKKFKKSTRRTALNAKKSQKLREDGGWMLIMDHSLKLP